MTPRTPTRAHPRGIPTPRPTLTAVLLLGAGGDVFVGEEKEEAEDEVDVVWDREELDLEEVVVEAVFAEATVLEELAMVVKGFKSPERVKVPSPVWQLHSATASLWQQKPLLPQLTTPASERELNKPDVASSGNQD
jgi:hypothetical protein